MSRTEIRHGCKINYALKVGRRLPDGYHEIESIFLPVQKPFDRLLITPSPVDGGIRVCFVDRDGGAGAFSGIDPQNNSLTRVYERYAELTGFRPGLALTVVKMIPPGGGLGGGSANAATFLLYLQAQAVKSGHTPLPQGPLFETAGSLGADIPFFLINKPALVSGIGEKIAPAPNPAQGLYLLLACPDIAVSTAWAYAELDRMREMKSTSGKDVEKLCKNNPEQGLTSELHQANYSSPERLPDYGNDFEEVVFARYPELARLKEQLLASGARKALLSGTGASVFGLFREGADAKAAEESLANQGILVYSQRI